MNTDNAVANATTPGESTTAASTATLSNTTTTAVTASNGYDPQQQHQQNRHSPLQHQQSQLNEVKMRL